MKSLQLLLVLAITSATVVLANPSYVKPSLLRGVIPQSWGQSRAACPENYAPCTCEQTTNGLEVTCLDVPVDQIREVFFRTRALNFYSVSLTASATGSVALPFDLLSNKVTQRLTLQCPPAASPPLTLTIDPATFEYTRRTTTFFEIEDCDLSTQADFTFLNGFDVLTSLRLVRTLNIGSFASLPAIDMRALKEIIITNSTGLGGIVFPDLTPARLERLYLDGNGLVDADVSSILVSVGGSSAVNTLQELTLSNNLLTKVPRTGSFSNLGTLDLSNNQIPFVAEFALNFPVSTGVQLISLRNSGVTAIEDGAFVGDYTKAEVNMEDNKLVDFREGVFKNMLTQMSVQPTEIAGHLYVTNNPFDCGCGLAWLIRDNANLIPSVKNGVCGGFFRFEDLNPDAYVNCP